MVSKILAILLATMLPAYAAPSLLACNPEACKAASCVILAKDEIWKITFNPDTKAEKIFVYKGLIESDDKAIRTVEVKRPMMVCGSGYPIGMGRLLRSRIQ